MKFTPDDFSALFSEKYPSLMGIKGVAAHIANIRLQEWLNNAPKIICAKGMGHHDSWIDEVDWQSGDDRPSHKAKLVCIEPIKE